MKNFIRNVSNTTTLQNISSLSVILLGSLLQHFFPKITISPEYLLLSSVVFEKINNCDFFSKNVFFNRKKLFTRSQTWRIYSPYYLQSKKKNNLKVAFSRKSIFKIFRNTTAIFSILKILVFFSDHSIELKIPHHMKEKPTKYAYLVKKKKLHHFGKYFGSFYEIVRLSSTAHHS